MDIRHLDYFVTVADCPSFTEAARQLQVTQSAVSYQIAELERRLEMKLFIRDRHAIRLTRAGEILRDEGRRLLRDMEETLARARLADQGELGTLRVGFLGSMERVMGATMRRFRQKHPQVDLQVEHHHMQGLEEALTRGTVDLALTVAVGLDLPEDYEMRTLFPDQAVAVLSAEHPLADREHLTLSDLREEPLILMTADSGQRARRWLMERFRRAGVEPRVSKETPSFENLLFLVETGQGVTILSRHIIQFYSHYQIRAVDLDGQDMDCRAVAIWKKALENPAAALFLAELEPTGT
nr:LysR family transcriptional regulator [uncultured Holophaga sp.]